MGKQAVASWQTGAPEWGGRDGTTTLKWQLGFYCLSLRVPTYFMREKLLYFWVFQKNYDLGYGGGEEVMVKVPLPGMLPQKKRQQGCRGSLLSTGSFQIPFEGN